ITLHGVGSDGDVPVEYRALIDDQLGGQQIPLVARGLLEFDAIGGGEISARFAFDYDGAGFHIGLHLRFLCDVKPPGGVDFAFEAALEPQALLKAHLSLERSIGTKDGGKFLITTLCHVASCELSVRAEYIDCQRPDN